ncbi:MAG TPA: hypothetical protein VH394_17150 [Thermoanaerobaculia bacterium]|nr:hypothetical protein [Thermoanaerobaculia bacterium]
MTALILMVLVASCFPPDKPMLIPALGEMDFVVVHHLKLPGTPVWTHEIRDPKRIAAILEHLRKHNTGYRADSRFHDPLFGSRDHEYKIDFHDKADTLPLIIWIGPNWIGGMDLRRGEPWSARYRRLRASERRELLALITQGEAETR